MTKSLYPRCQMVFFPVVCGEKLSGEAAILTSGFFSRSSRSRLHRSIFTANNRKKTCFVDLLYFIASYCVRLKAETEAILVRG